MRKFTKLASIAFISILGFTSCERDNKTDVLPVVPPSDGSKMTLEGGEGGTDAANAVYVDLSTDKQTSVARKSWSLGFYSGSAFRVNLNNHMAYSAMVTNQTDIKAVNSTNVDLTKLNYNFQAKDQLQNYDDTAGRIEKSLIAEIKATESENKVYVINPVHPNADKANVWKVKINRGTAQDYVLQYAMLDDTNFKSLTIKKDNKLNFNFISFADGPVNVEPAKDEWDLVWTKSIYFTAMGGAPIPYFFSDLVFINHLNGVSVSEVVFLGKDNKSNGQPNYEEFDSSKLSGIKFKNNRNVMATSWRNTLSVGVLRDRFYVIKDKAGNIYKLRFLAMGVKDDGGKRGYPEIEYKLVKSN